MTDEDRWLANAKRMASEIDKMQQEFFDELRRVGLDDEEKAILKRLKEEWK